MMLSGGEMLPPGEAMVFSHAAEREVRVGNKAQGERNVQWRGQEERKVKATGAVEWVIIPRIYAAT
jgi:hypothetical protein